MTPKEPGKATRSSIVQAAIVCIQREGIEGVTSRSIAKEAAVNLAALNYHFGSKERVIELALAFALQSAFDDSLTDYDRFVRRHETIREAMIALLDETLESATRFPNVGFALVHQTVAKQVYETPFVERLNAFIDGLFTRVRPALRGTNDAQRRASLVQLWSNVILIGIMPRVFDRTFGASLSDPDTRLVFVRSMVDCHFVAAKASVPRPKAGRPKRSRQAR